MQSAGREPSMEDILASIKKVIAEEKELRGGIPASPHGHAAPEEQMAQDPDEDVLELVETLAPPADLGPPLVDEEVAGQSRQALEQLQTVAASIPAAPPANPLEDLVREMLRPILKQWLDDHLPAMVDEHVKREITRITGRPL
jgi:cell pole-organizing protein PopZ